MIERIGIIDIKKEDMDKLLNKLGEWIKVIQAALLGTVIVETILVIVIGIASNNITNNYWAGILIACSILYVFLVIIRTVYQLKFPSSIIDELTAKRQLEEKNKLFDRQKAINEYINSAIQGLNEQTCSIDLPDSNEHLCDQELGVRLTQLLQPIVSYTDVILDTSTEKKFTIGVYLDHYKKFPNDYNEFKITINNENSVSIDTWELISDSGVLLLKDELELANILPKELLAVESISGASFEIQTTIRKTINNLSFNTHTFSHNNKDYGIICSEILEVCSDEFVNGVLFVIYNSGIKFPTDVPEVLRIFNRITANYVSKYNSCILNEVVAIKRKSMNDAIAQ